VPQILVSCLHDDLTVIVSCDIFIETNFDDGIQTDIVFVQGDPIRIVSKLCGDIIRQCVSLWYLCIILNFYRGRVV